VTARDDYELARWLSDVTGVPQAQVAAELAAGEARRAFVAEELLEAGLRGSELLDCTVRLTGLDEEQARTLLSSHGS
jgi:hypothetical protein